MHAEYRKNHTFSLQVGDLRNTLKEDNFIKEIETMMQKLVQS